MAYPTFLYICNRRWGGYISSVQHFSIPYSIGKGKPIKEEQVELKFGPYDSTSNVGVIYGNDLAHSVEFSFVQPFGHSILCLQTNFFFLRNITILKILFI